MNYLNLEKSVVDDTIARVLEMRVNRGLGVKMFKKKIPMPIMRRDNFEQNKLREHKLKVA